jgi:hypothetical protein
VGEFKLDVVDFNEINFFSHSLPVEELALKNHFTIYLKTKQVWAMYKIIPCLK